jgi:glycosyltransferase involved in cell wall biosynthesis
MSTGKLSIIIPIYNRKDVLGKGLKAYRFQTAQQEILVRRTDEEVVVADCAD